MLPKRKKGTYNFCPRYPPDVGQWLAKSKVGRTDESFATHQTVRKVPPDTKQARPVQPEAPVARKRNDVPKVRDSEKGAMDSALTADTSKAPHDLVDGMYAATSRAPRDALWNAWQDQCLGV